jgi:predicted hydrocarbon binding protein
MDAWRLKEFTQIGHFNEFSSASDIEKKLKKHPNFWKLMKLPKCPEKLYQRYMKVREMNVYSDDDLLKSVSREDIERSLLLMSLRDIMQNDTTLSINRIILHIKNEYGIVLTKSQVEYIMNDATMIVKKLNEKSLSYDSKELKERKPVEIEELKQEAETKDV